MRIRDLLALLVLPATALAAPLSLLEVPASSPTVVTGPAAPARTAPVAIAQPAGPDAESITTMARVIAAEAGGDSFSSLPAKKAVGAAVVNTIKKRYGVRAVRRDDIRRLLRDQPGYLSSLSDGNRHFFTRDAKWLRGHGYAGCLTAARAALSGEDPSRGATNWYDDSIAQPYSSSKIRITARAKTAGSTIVFYSFR